MNRSEPRNRTEHAALVRSRCFLERSPWSRSRELHPAILRSERSRPLRTLTSKFTGPGHLTSATFGAGKAILSCGWSEVCDDTDCRPARSNGSQRRESDPLRTPYERVVRPPDTASSHAVEVMLPTTRPWRPGRTLVLHGAKVCQKLCQPLDGAFTYAYPHQVTLLASNVRSVRSDLSMGA